MSTIRYCGQCGYANEINARFCGQCGHTLPALSPIPATPIPSGSVLTSFQLVLPYVIGAFGLLMVSAGILLYTDGCVAGLDLFRRCPIITLFPNPSPTPLSTATLVLTRTSTATPSPSPTPTPSATSTATPSPTASLTPKPTLTPTVTPTNTPTLTPTPTPVVCGYAVDRTFAAATAGYLDDLGCALHAGRTVWMAEEDFVGGRTFWRQDNDKYIYVLYANGTWRLYRGDWIEGDAEYTCGQPQSPPTPRRGFGWVWCTYPEVQQGLGNATNYEWGTYNYVQDFSGGLVIRSSSRRVYLLLNNGTWR